MTFKEKLDLFTDDYCKTHPFSGMLRVTLKDEIIYKRNVGYADHENKLSFTDESNLHFTPCQSLSVRLVL